MRRQRPLIYFTVGVLAQINSLSLNNNAKKYSKKQKKEESYLVDPASSHMLVSKIKPCMSKYKQICTVKLRMAH